MRMDEYWPHEISGFEKNTKGHTIYTFEPVDVTIKRVFPPKLDGSGFQFSTGWTFVEDTTQKGDFVGEIWSNPGVDWDAQARSFGGPYNGPIGNEGDRVKVTLSRVVTGGPKDFFNLKRLAVLESSPGAANGPQPGSAASPAAPAGIAPTSAPVEQRILQGMALNNLTHALSAGKTARISDALAKLETLWGEPADAMWVALMASAAEGVALPLITPAIVEAAAELDTQADEKINAPEAPPNDDAEELPW